MSAAVQVYIAAPAGAATPVMADPSTAPFTQPPVRVTLSVDCQQLCPPGWPSPPDETGAAQAHSWSPRLITAGTTITAFACVAAALIAADAATPA